MIQILELAAEHPDRDRVLGLLTDAQHDELWDDGRHKPSEVPADALWWVARDGSTIVALGALWRESDGVWRSGCNAELGWRGRTERYWPDVHRTRQPVIAALGEPVTTWLHDQHPDTGEHDDVVRVHIETGWTLTGEQGWSFDIPGQWCVQMAWAPARAAHLNRPPS